MKIYKILIFASVYLASSAEASDKKFYGGVSVGSGKLFYSKSDVGLSDADFSPTSFTANVSFFAYYALNNYNRIGPDFTGISEFSLNATAGDGIYSLSYWRFLSESLSDSSVYYRIGLGPADRSSERNDVILMRRVWGYGGFLAFGKAFGKPEGVTFFGEIKYVGTMIKSVPLQHLGFSFGVVF